MSGHESSEVLDDTRKTQDQRAGPPGPQRQMLDGVSSSWSLPGKLLWDHRCYPPSKETRTRPGRKQHVQIKRILEAHRRLLQGLHVRFSSMIENIGLAA